MNYFADDWGGPQFFPLGSFSSTKVQNVQPLDRLVQ
jgi:hypothetical protein